MDKWKSLLILILLLTASCSKKVVKVQEVERKGIWTEKYSIASGVGEIHLITPERKINAMFDYTYNRKNRELKGSFYGFLGVKVAQFTITPTKIDVETITGKKNNIDSVLSKAGIPIDFFLKCFTYDFPPNIIAQKGINVTEGALVSTSDFDLLLSHKTGLPIKVVALNRGKDIQVVYKNFKTVSGYSFPFDILFSESGKRLEIHLKKLVIK